MLIVSCVPKTPQTAPREPLSKRRIFLAEHRKAQGLNQEEVGDRMGGKNKSYVSRLETGKIQVTTHLMFLYADAIRVAPERLFRQPGELTMDDMVNAIPKELQAPIRDLVASQYKNRPK